MKKATAQYDEIDLTGVVPTRLSAEDVTEINQFIKHQKAQQKPYDVQQIVIRLLKNGKLSVEEIAACLNISLNQIMALESKIKKSEMA
jgi:DNA-binding CsgD family transcriptional regulator